MLSEKLKELKSNTDKKQNIEKDIKEGEKIEEKNKIKLLKINELKEILDTYKKAKEKSNNLEEIFLLITRNNTRTKKKRTTSKKYNKLNKQYIEKENQYNEEEDKFFREQAGIIAKRLEEGKPCPVCGSIEHPNKAIKSEDVLSEDELKQLEAEKNKVENKRNTIKNEIILLNAKIEATIKTIPESNKNDFNLEKFIEHINQTKISKKQK